MYKKQKTKKADQEENILYKMFSTQNELTYAEILTELPNLPSVISKIIENYVGYDEKDLFILRNKKVLRLQKVQEINYETNYKDKIDLTNILFDDFFKFYNGDINYNKLIKYHDYVYSERGKNATPKVIFRYFEFYNAEKLIMSFRENYFIAQIFTKGYDELDFKIFFKKRYDVDEDEDDEEEDEEDDINRIHKVYLYVDNYFNFCQEFFSTILDFKNLVYLDIEADDIEWNKVDPDYFEKLQNYNSDNKTNFGVNDWIHISSISDDPEKNSAENLFLTDLVKESKKFTFLTIPNLYGITPNFVKYVKILCVENCLESNQINLIGTMKNLEILEYGSNMKISKSIKLYYFFNNKDLYSNKKLAELYKDFIDVFPEEDQNLIKYLNPNYLNNKRLNKVLNVLKTEEEDLDDYENLQLKLYEYSVKNDFLLKSLYQF